MSTSGPVKALQDLDAGKVDAAVGGLDFNDWMALMAKDGYPISDTPVYQPWVIGKDTIRVLTNPDVEVDALTKEQVAAIFTGKAINWSDVGGPDKPIVVILGSKIPGTQAVFHKQNMGGAPYIKQFMQGTTSVWI